MDVAAATEALRSQLGTEFGINATLKFDFGDGNFVYVDGLNAPNSITNEDKDSQCNVKLTFEDFLGILNGSIDAMDAFFGGVLEIDGDMDVAMKIGQIL